MSFTPLRRPVVLCVMDGWGWREDETDNAIALADTPNFDRMLAECPNALLKTSGLDVGLPGPQMGNSEVGHLNLGAGRIVAQDTRRIDAAIEEGSLADQEAIKDLIAALKQSGGSCHLLGLISPGGVHSHQDQIVAIARIIAAQGIGVKIHAFLDGRDTPPRSADEFMESFLAEIADAENISVVTVSGRFYAMDRDKRWDRVEQAWKALVEADGLAAATPQAAISQSYDADTGDEFVLPTIIGDYDGMKDGDAVLMGNFRADRAREILTTLLDPDFDGFDRPRFVEFAAAAGLVEYSLGLNDFMSTVFPPVELKDIFADVISEQGLTQLRIAETEKYAHVTFFFNGGVEEPFPGEDRILVPSPDVATYDLKPEMSADEVTDRLVEAIESGRYDFIFVNYANPDMVGHTGILDAAIKAITKIDQCIGRLEKAVTAAGGAMLITADHGNAEMMTDPETGEPFTSHTLNAVPAILVNAPEAIDVLNDGRLADVAPTLLDLIGLQAPDAMSGVSLISGQENSKSGTARSAAE